MVTPCAQRGIFRYYDNWNNGNALAATTTGTTPVIAIVDNAGNPRAPATNPDGSPHNGILRYASVFGPLLTTPVRPDCSDAVVQQGNPWDTYRRGLDATGYVQNVLFKFMPPANSYDIGDGLNTAGSRRNRTLHGATNLFGIGQYPQRKQINLKLDHSFNTKNKISGTWNYESNWADGYTSSWPNTWIGRNWVKPQIVSANFTSTLSPTIVNEARFGIVRSGVNQIGPLHYEKNDALRDLLPKANGVLWAPYLGAGTGDSAVNFQFSHIIGGTNFAPAITQIDQSPRYVYADTISWTRGKHAFKTGAEFRTTSSKSTWTGNAGTGGAFNAVHLIMWTPFRGFTAARHN